MYVTFNNVSTQTKAIITVENQKYIINPGHSAEIFCCSEKITFRAQTSAFDEFNDLAGEFDSEEINDSLKDKILNKVAKKFVEKLSDLLLDVSLDYEVSFANPQDTVVNLYEGIYSVCDSVIAEVLDLNPVAFVFARAEVENGQIKVVDANPINRKKYLKQTRNFLLWSHQWFLSIDWFLFIPEYALAKHYSSPKYLKKLFSKFYSMPKKEREKTFIEKEQIYETEKAEKKGCGKGFITFLIVLAVLGAIVFWGMTSEPDVIVSEDFQMVECFEETFYKIETGLPPDAEKAFLEQYSAYYILSDGEYDMDNYYCYIYEDSSGERYMWLKDNCTKEENQNKDYNEYENPLVYKSTVRVMK